MNDRIIQDREFAIFAISLITHDSNLNASLNLLLNRLAKHYQLDMVALFEYDEHMPTMELTNYYCESVDIYEHTVFKRSLPEVEEMMPGECKILHLQQLTDTGNVTYRRSDESKPGVRQHCAVVGKFSYLGGRLGAVFYTSFDPDRVWDEADITFLGELTGIISLYVSLRTRMNEQESQMNQMRECDRLTGLYHIDEFKKQVQAAMYESDPNKAYAMLALDINNFGYVNENYGFRVGDEVLVHFAKESLAREQFVVGCRLYSDYFLLLLVHENKEALLQFANEQNLLFSNVVNHQYPSSGMGISAGVCFMERGSDVDIAIENASLARKAAKLRRNNICIEFTPQMRRKRTEEQHVIGEFYEALYRGDFRMYLQPKFTLGRHRIYGAEALARWQKPDGEILSPAVFIEPLERIGYIVELDFYIYEEVLKTMTRWQEQRKPLITVSTNFSGRHFEQDGEKFMNRIIHILHKYTIPARYIEIEITEGVLVRNLDNLKRCMLRLKEEGFRIAIDDFGTGYSSLAVLFDVPSDVIKMDRSFINREQTEKDRRILVELRNFIRIAGKETICEGIETAEQESLLIDCGYEYGQGFLCSCPVNIGEFERKYLSRI